MVAITQLLATKFYIPRARSTLVARPRLLERLDQGTKGKLTLISALPGSGKTTLVSEWQASPAGSRFPLAWVSLDEGDNDPTRFWSYIGKAVETVSEGISADMLALLNSFPSPPIESVLISFINAIDNSIREDFGLVLDDYHCIETESIHTGLAFLLDHLPPKMHLILITRVDPPLPLARLRVRGYLTEIRTADLRFTRAETERYLNQTMNLHLLPENAARLAERTEGWIAGIQLAALSLQGQEDMRDVLRTFNGNQRYVLEYLAQEVLERQPAHIQQFLQETAILRCLSAESCDAVTEGSDSQQVLHWLEKANLFLISLDQEQHWYRYHRLFGDFLLSSLRKTHAQAAIRALHLRAARWYEQHGLLNDAIHHMLEGAAFERAAELIERIARSEWMRGDAATLQNWIQALPESLLHARPQLGLFYTWSLIATNQTGKAQQQLEAVAAVIQENVVHPPSNEPLPPDTVAMQAEVVILQATLARFQNDVQRTIELSEQARHQLPPNNTVLKSINTLNLGHAYRLRGNTGDAIETFKQALTLARAIGNSYVILLALNNLFQFEIEHGALRSAAVYCKESLQYAALHGCQQLPIMSQTYLEEGVLLYEWNRLDEAAQRLEQSIQLAQDKGNRRFLLLASMAQARLLQTQGNSELAQQLLVQASDLARENAATALLQRIEALQARLWLAQGQLTPAFSWLKQCMLSIEDDPDYTREFEYLTLARLLIAQGKGKEVGGQLERIRQAALKNQRMSTVIETLFLQALANFARHQPVEAYTALERALSLAEPEGYIRLFIDEGQPAVQLLTKFVERQGNTSEWGSTAMTLYDYARALVSASKLLHPVVGNSSSQSRANSAQSLRPMPLIEALGERETEVLHYLAAGLSNQAIAEEMVVATSTVKSHLKSIYRKLNVDSRTQAIARARELNLL
jgi:LuxR family maltose regulon positive regulatory protein